MTDSDVWAFVAVGLSALALIDGDRSGGVVIGRGPISTMGKA